jgi:ABC-type multidrug transport system fused ATPase/permease subunit
MDIIKSLREGVAGISKGYRYVISFVLVVGILLLVAAQPNVLGFAVQVFGILVGAMLFVVLLGTEIQAIMKWITHFLNQEKTDGSEQQAGVGVDSVPGVGVEFSETETDPEQNRQGDRT